MSYKLTEAERKHVAAIEDVELFMERKPATNGSVPETIIHVTDGDKLDLSAVLPKYKFVWTAADDEKARLRLVDDASGYEISCDGLVDESGNAQGIGWRYTVYFSKDDDGYVNEITLKRINDGLKKVLTFNNFSDLTIKNLVIGKEGEENSGDLTVNKNLNVKGKTGLADTAINGTLDVTNSGSRFNGVVVGGKHYGLNTTTRTDGPTGIKVGDIDAKTANIENFNVDSDETADSAINNQNIKIENSTIFIPNTTSVVIEEATINTVNSETVNVSDELNVNAATAQKLNSKETALENKTAISGATSIEGTVSIEGTTRVDGTFSAEQLDVDKNITANSVAVTGKTYSGIVETPQANIEKAYIDNEEVTNSTIKNAKVDDATIGAARALSTTTSTLDVTSKAVIANAEVYQATITNEDVAVSNIAEANVDLLLTDEVRTSDNKYNIVEVAGKNEIIGDDKKVLVIRSAAEGLPTEKSYERIRVDCGESSSYLATLEDLQESGINGVVDLTTNQTINGVKTFRKEIISHKGLFGYNEWGRQDLRNIITRQYDQNDDNNSAFTPNPVYAPAQAMFAAYNNNTINFKAAKKAYNAAYSAEKTFIAATAANNSAIDDAKALGENVVRIADLIEDYEAKAAAEEALLTENTEKLAEVKSDLTIYNGYALKKEKAQDEAATAYLADGFVQIFDSFTAALTAKNFGLDEKDEDLIKVKRTEASMVSRIEALQSYNDRKAEEVGYATVLDKINKFINDEYHNFTYSYSVDTSLPWVVNYPASDIQGLIDTYYAIVEDTEMFDGNDQSNLTTWQTLKNNESYLTDTVALETTTLANYKATLEDLYAEQKTATTNKEEADKKSELTDESLKAAEIIHNDTFKAFEKAINNYFKVANYKLCPEWCVPTEDAVSVKAIPEDISKIPAPEATTENYDEELYTQYRLGLIPETIVTGFIDHTVVVGNDEDELQLRTDSLADGDEHIQATIGGHYHRVANLDDILATNFAEGTDNKVIGDVDINTVENGIEFLVKKDDILQQYYTPEDLKDLIESHDYQVGTVEGTLIPKTTEEKIFGMVGRGLVTIEPQKDEEDNIIDNTAMIGIDPEMLQRTTLETVSGLFVKRTDITQTINEEGVTVTNIIYNVDGEEETRKVLNLQSDKDLEITVGDDKNVKIDLKNVYERDLDLSDAMGGYIAAYKGLEAIDTNRNLIPNAIAVKSLYSDSLAETAKVQNNLDTRVPTAPKMSGRYGLVATVHANADGTEMSSVYSWDGTITGVPEVLAYDKLTGKTLNVPDTDWDGDEIVDYTPKHANEYTIKMRLYKNVAADGTVTYTPTMKWAKLV